MDPLTDERREALALLLLAGLPGVGEATVRRLVETLGSGREALGAAPAAFAAVAGPAAEASRHGKEHRERAEGIVAWCERAGVRPLPLGAADYPATLLDLTGPPPVLFVRGDVALLSRPGVAVVGARAATAYGRRSAERIAHLLARNGIVVVSGLALGVDGAAHRAALEAGGPTVAVMGNGPDRVHPAAHRGLARRIAERGLLATELPPGAEARSHHFPKRNRILAALSRAVVVVEAARRSGALITARLAGEMGRDVLAVPGPMDATTSQGSNWLLAEGNT
ncbi:MAG: DNA-processing protein DprA, partial [Gemmatimonadetes bacterium]|nr:DNA-processing protein DprA [Gemmatimonadota bacterium]